MLWRRLWAWARRVSWPPVLRPVVVILLALARSVLGCPGDCRRLAWVPVQTPTLRMSVSHIGAPRVPLKVPRW